MALNNSNTSGSSNNLSGTTSPNNNNDPDNVKQGNLVVRMDEDSATKLQALFDTVLKPSEQNRPLQIPLRMRKLPNSFFNPPSTGSKSPSVSHSRENSIDSAFGSGTTIVYAPGGGTGGGTGAANSVLTQRLSISHSRAHSSPATLEQTHAAGLKSAAAAAANSNGTATQTATAQPQTPLKAVHSSQRSYDVISAIQLQDELGDLPPGWEQARTAEGQIYYLNHMTRTTQWEDPRKQLAAQQALAAHQSADSLLRSQPTQQSQQPAIQQNSGNPVTKLSSPSTVASDPLLGPLPEGWEQAMTSAGETYFINHINRTTSWFDPRIPEHFQRQELSRTAGGWLNIQNLQKEREYLKQRQQEIQHQTISLQMDPFLPGVTDHSRQESGDSGLSLTSNHYSMPHTPDFLANMDDSMDCISESGNLDTSTLENTDDLVPSLQLGEGFNNDILDDVHSLMDSEVKTDSLTWI